ncbi:MAG: acyl-CoA dehydrogenase [Alphaproteobacteria bacterium]|nr:acyl-CoA dehydrogenase [Alphaproteobacteria bacterium]
MDFTLTTEHNLIVDTVRKFVDVELLPHEDEVDRTGEVSEAIKARVRERALAEGLYAMNMPAEVGGGGLDNVTMMLVEKELGRAGYALHYLVARPSMILMACQGEQRERYLLPTVKGDRVDCFAITEPGAGSDAFGITSRAVADGEDFVINGTKHFISHADLADFVIVFAVTGMAETPKGPRKQVTSFLVDKGTPGFSCTRQPDAISHRGFHQCTLTFEDCRVHKRQILGALHKGFDVANEWLYAQRLVLAANCLGRAERILKLAAEWAGGRKQFGQTISKFQGVSFKFADMATELAAAELLTLRAAWKADQGTMTAEDAAMAKLKASEMLAMVADEGVQVFGGMGVMGDMAIARLWRDARVERIWDGTSEIQRHIISRAVLRPFET